MEVKTKTIVIPPQVEEMLRYLEGCGWWPFALQVDAPWLNNLWLRFGKTVNLMETFLRFESWQYDRASKGKPLKNHRLAFRNFCENAEKYRLQAKTPFRKDETPKRAIDGRPAPTPPAARPSTPGRREAGNAVPAAGINVHDLAAGIVRKKRVGVEVSGHAPDRVKKIIAEAVLNSGLVKPLPTQEELESNRQRQLADYRKNKGEGNAQ